VNINKNRDAVLGDERVGRAIGRLLRAAGFEIEFSLPRSIKPNPARPGRAETISFDHP